MSPTWTPACLAGGATQVAGAASRHWVTVATVSVCWVWPYARLMPRKMRNASRMFMSGPPNMTISFCHVFFW